MIKEGYWGIKKVNHVGSYLDGQAERLSDGDVFEVTLQCSECGKTVVDKCIGSPVNFNLTSCPECGSLMNTESEKAKSPLLYKSLGNKSLSDFQVFIEQYALVCPHCNSLVMHECAWSKGDLQGYVECLREEHIKGKVCPVCHQTFLPFDKNSPLAHLNNLPWMFLSPKERCEEVKILSGREEGVLWRELHGLDKRDLDDKKYLIIVPNYYAITVSYFLACFGESIQVLGKSRFETKYIFFIKNQLLKQQINEHIKSALNNDLPI